MTKKSTFIEVNLIQFQREVRKYYLPWYEKNNNNRDSLLALEAPKNLVDVFLKLEVDNE